MKRFRSILFLLAAALLFGAAPARAYLLAVEVIWWPDAHPTLAEANLQEGSIIQIVAYNSTGSGVTTIWDHNDPNANFTPYGTSFLPDTTPDGHQILGSGSIQNLSSEYGPGVYGMTTLVDVPDAYDSVYVRVFSSGFAQGVVSSNVYWGISGVSNNIDTTFGTALTWFDNVEAPATNVVNFELIPEPSSLAFLLSGGGGMGVFALFRRRRQLRPPEE